jgi:unsaturated rhamnogalacturonyl hydrolase
MTMAVAGLSGRSEGVQSMGTKGTQMRSNMTKTIIEKVKMAMLCMQRYSWEQGTAMQGMLEIGDTTNLVIMARESVQRKKPDGRLSMVGSDMNIADTGVNGAGVLAAYKITGDEKYKKAAQEQYEYLKRPESKNAKGVIYHNNKSVLSG